MAIRMFEYGSQIALDAGELEGNVLTVRFPESAVLYLRSRASTPDFMTIRIELPGGEFASYSIPVLKAHRYTPDEIFSKGLLFLIPFRIFSHEARFMEYERDASALRTLTLEYEGIKRRLEELSESGKVSEYVKRTLEEMSGKVLEHIARGYERVREGVRTIMGGKVLEYEAKSILNEGIVLGRNEGIVLGRDEGRAEGEVFALASVARRMIARGLPSAEISANTGLSVDEVEALRGSEG